MKSVVLTLWVFTRSKDLCTFAYSFTLSQPPSVADLVRLSDALLTACPDWKHHLHARSRDYSINTSSLDCGHARWVLRAAMVLHNFLQHPIPDPEPAARYLRSHIGACGGFITQHLVWALQLLGVVTSEVAWTWATLKHYCSNRNTIKLFRRFIYDFSGRPACPFASSGPGPSGQHIFANPMRDCRRITDDEAGVFMVETFKFYQEGVAVMPSCTFRCTLMIDGEPHTFEKQFDDAECMQLNTWLCFAANACMLERFWQDHFADLA